MAAVVLQAGDDVEFSVIGAERTVGIFAEMGIECLAPGEPERHIVRLAPDAYLYGRTRYPSDDRRLVAVARHQGIPSTLVLDEWYYYRRAVLDEFGNSVFIPDHICCPDEWSRGEAMGEGLPGDRLVVTGSPALAELADRIAQFDSSPPPIPASFEAGLPRPLIVFLSETHSDDYGGAPGEHRRLGAYLGYDENTVREDIAAVLSDLDRPCTVIEKLHPSITRVPPPPETNRKTFWKVVHDAPLWPLIWHGDLVVGMMSMALLETALMGRTALSYQPDLIGADLCTAARLELIDKGRSRVDLERWFQEGWSKAGRRSTGPLPCPPFADPRAARNVLAVALGGNVA